MMRGSTITTITAPAALLLVSSTVAGLAQAGREETKNPAEQAPEPRYVVEVREVKQVASKTCDLREDGKRLLEAQLGKVPNVTTRRPAAAKRSESPGAEGYALVLRIVRCEHALKPPPPGRAYRVLTADVAVALDAEKIPSGQLARAGDGEAQVGTEVQRIKPSELRELQSEALAAAIEQSVGKFVKSLDEKAHAKRKTARRKRRR